MPAGVAVMASLRGALRGAWLGIWPPHCTHHGGPWQHRLPRILCLQLGVLVTDGLPPEVLLALQVVLPQGEGGGAF